MGEEERKWLDEIELADVVDGTAARQALDKINSGEEERSTGGFTYDFLNDPMYQQYRSQYMESANRAMKDAMGQAAALTGGYGSSYAQRVGQQAYDRTMQGLNDVIPDLYKVAYQRYQDDYQRQQDAYQTLSALILSTGYNPSEDELTKAGMSAEEAKAMAQKYAQDMALQQQQLQIQYMNAMPRSTGGGGSGYNASVAQLQQQLNSMGANLDVDGIWGPNTEAAYAKYMGGSSSGGNTSPGSGNTAPRTGITAMQSMAQTAAAKKAGSYQGERQGLARDAELALNRGQISYAEYRQIMQELRIK